MKKIIKIFLYFTAFLAVVVVALFILGSTGNDDKTASNNERVRNQREDVQKSTSELLEIEVPEEGFIPSYRLKSYEEMSYIELCDTLQMAKEAFEFSEAMHIQDLIKAKENDILGQLVNKDISEVASFYANNWRRYDFLEEFIKETVVDDLSSQPYRYIKNIHDAFSGLPLSDRIDSIYFNLRDSLLVDINSELDVYFEQEMSTLMALKENAEVELEQYIDSMLVQIQAMSLERTEESLVKMMKRRKRNDMNAIPSRESMKEDMSDFVMMLCTSRFSLLSAKEVFSNDLKDLVLAINPIRASYLREWLQTDVMPPSVALYIPDIYPYEITEFEAKDDIVRSIASGILDSKIKNVIWEAVGLIPVVGDIAAIPDIVINTIRDNKEKSQIRSSLEEFVIIINDCAVQFYDEILTKVFDRAAKEIESSQDNMRKYIYETL